MAFWEVEPIRWEQLTETERSVMEAIAVVPKTDVEWMVQRKLCYYQLAEIMPKGLTATWFGRHVMAARYGLPVVVGRDRSHQSLIVI